MATEMANRLPVSLSPKRKHTPDGRGKNPNSLRNLIPIQPGHRPNEGNPYPVSRHLKDLLRDEKNGRDVAETMLRTANMPDSRGYSTALTQLLDRTEGKVKEETLPVAPGSQVLNIIVVGGGENLTDIIAQVKERTKKLAIGEG